MIRSIRSKRLCDNRAFFAVCYEWEDELSKKMSVPISNINKTEFNITRAVRKLSPKSYHIRQNLRKDTMLYFAMFVKELRFYSNVNGIPIFIDVWGNQEIEYIVEKTRGFSLFYVTSIDVYNKIKELDVTSHVHYMPLSVPDKYFSKDFARYHEKSIDVIQMGRKNPLLHKWVLKYVASHPDVEYVYTEKTSNDAQMEYISTKRGNIGSLKGREEFIHTLSSSRISLVSSPAIDNPKRNMFGIDYPTPRFYESAALGCALIGRYTENEESNRLKLNSVCPNVTSYEMFSSEVDKALAIPVDTLYSANSSFIFSNLTSRRAIQITEDLNKIVE